MWDDNNAFLQERQANSAEFFDFFKQLIETEKVNELVELQQTDIIRSLYQIVKIMVFKLLVYSKDSKGMLECSNILRQILEADDQCVLDLGQLIVENDGQEMIRILLKCSEGHI